MGKHRKNKGPTLQDLISEPWCYYCERTFADLNNLSRHQKSKHFKCTRCSRRLNTAGGLSVHMQQVHKETLTHVEHALDHRSGLDVEIFGMEGIPQDILDARRNTIANDWRQQEESHRERTGNPLPGGEVRHRPKIAFMDESAEEKKKRFWEWRKLRDEEGNEPSATHPTYSTPPIGTNNPYAAPSYSGAAPPSAVPYGTSSTKRSADALETAPEKRARVQPSEQDVSDLIASAAASAAPEKKKDKKGVPYAGMVHQSYLSPEELVAKAMGYPISD